MQKNRDDRFSSARSLSRELRHWLEEHPQHDGETAEPAGPRQRQRLVAAAAGAASLVLAGLAWWGFAPHDDAASGLLARAATPASAVAVAVPPTASAPAAVPPADAASTMAGDPAVSATGTDAFGVTGARPADDTVVLVTPADAGTAPAAGLPADGAAGPAPGAATAPTAPAAPWPTIPPASPAPPPPALTGANAPPAVAPASLPTVKMIPVDDAKAPPKPKDTARTAAARDVPKETPKDRRAREARERAEKKAAAAPVLVATGTVRLAVSPWGQVEVDGRPVGTAPPLNELSLPEGRHTVTIRNDEFPPFSATVNVVAGQPVNVKHRFGS